MVPSTGAVSPVLTRQAFLRHSLTIPGGGYFKISATGLCSHKQLYLPDTNVLITRFFSNEGIGEVIDFMPIEACSLRGEQAYSHQIIRRVSTVSGKVRFRLECFPAFNYARDPHEIRSHPQGVVACLN